MKRLVGLCAIRWCKRVLRQQTNGVLGGFLKAQPTNHALGGDAGPELRGIDGDLRLSVEGLSLTIEQL